ncbi:MAG: YIP1 family protein, partial [Gemmatimonadota bacterium]|nr:YIP1 family protein [Gemmatimonadota bacterium]
LGAVLVAAGVLLIPVEIWETQLRGVFLERGQPLPGDPSRLARINRIAGSVGGPIVLTIIALAMAGLSTLVFAFILGDRGRFKQYFAAVVHAFLIASIGGLAITPLRIAAEDPQLLMSIGNALRGILPDGYFLNVLRGLDVFGIWANVLLAIAVTKIDPRRSFGSAFAFYMAISIGLAMITATFI